MIISPGLPFQDVRYEPKDLMAISDETYTRQLTCIWGV